MQLVVVDQVGSNIGSLLMCLQRLGLQQEHDYKLSHDSRVVSAASHVILAGVGSAVRAMAALERHGLVEVIREAKMPVLGICVGMQILYESSQEGGGRRPDGEDGEHLKCLGVLTGSVRRIQPPPDSAIIHNGWNQLQLGLDRAHQFKPFVGEYVYFIHQYAAEPCASQDLLYVDYGEKIPALVQYQNYYGMQFHPEKSAAVGLTMLEKFLSLC